MAKSARRFVRAFSWMKDLPQTKKVRHCAWVLRSTEALQWNAIPPLISPSTSSSNPPSLFPFLLQVRGGDVSRWYETAQGIGGSVHFGWSTSGRQTESWPREEGRISIRVHRSPQHLQLFRRSANRHQWQRLLWIQVDEKLQFYLQMAWPVVHGFFYEFRSLISSFTFFRFISLSDTLFLTIFFCFLPFVLVLLFFFLRSVVIFLGLSSFPWTSLPSKSPFRMSHCLPSFQVWSLGIGLFPA